MTYETRDRSQLRAEDRALCGLIPPQAVDIKLWSFKFRGYWAGQFRIDGATLEAWARESQLQRYHGAALIEAYDTDGRCRYVDTLNGPVYRLTRWKNDAMISSDYLLYYDDSKGLAHFTLSME